MMASNEIVKFANENKQVTTIWCAPTYRQSKLAFDIIIKNFKAAMFGSTKSPLQITWRNGSVTKFLSTESKDSLRGDTAHLIVVDEAAMVEEEVWSNILRPMLSDTDGKAILISTPKSKNWFYRLFMRGQDDTYTDYSSFTFPTSANPYIPPSEIEEVKMSLPESVFKQEYQAEFLEDGGTVFRDVRGCINEHLTIYHDGANQKKRSYILGYDIAKHSDYSVVVVLDAETLNLVYFDRFNRIDYNVQVERVAKIALKFNNAKILLDSTGVGDPILESVKAKGLNADGFLFTNTSKQQLIEHLAVLIERKEIGYPNIKVLVNELSAYQFEISRAGNMKYGAPSGMHDDCVVALALAAWGAKHQRNPRVLLL